jgi:ribosome recycling factor
VTEEILLDAEARMDEAVQAYERSMATFRTGRASTALVEGMLIDHYDSQMQLNQLANLATPDASLITITPWDKSTVDPIMRAIQQSDLGITPSSDGLIIRLPIPALTEERRRELVKQLGGRTEDARVSVRNARRHAHDEVKRIQRDHDISDDAAHDANAEVDRLTQEYVSKVEELAKQKEADLMEV